MAAKEPSIEDAIWGEAMRLLKDLHSRYGKDWRLYVDPGEVAELNGLMSVLDGLKTTVEEPKLPTE